MTFRFYFNTNIENPSSFVNAVWTAPVDIINAEYVDEEDSESSHAELHEVLEATFSFCCSVIAVWFQLHYGVLFTN